MDTLSQSTDSPPSGPATGGNVPSVAPAAPTTSPPAPGATAAESQVSPPAPAPTSGASEQAKPSDPYASARAGSGGGAPKRKRTPATLRDRIVARLLAGSRGAAERAADALLDGTYKGETFVGSYSAPLTRITDGTRITSADGVDTLIPAPSTAKAGKRSADKAPSERAQRVLALRREGKRRAEIAKAVGITSKSVAALLARHGDPAPQATHDAERADRERAEQSSLKVAARKLGVTVEQLMAMRPVK